MTRKPFQPIIGLFLILSLLASSFGCQITTEIKSQITQRTPTQEPIATATPKPPPTQAQPQTTISTPTPTSPTINLTVHFIDVGQGDAILIDYGETEILIDGGEKSPGVVDYIRPYIDGTLEVMIATHTHADHIGGLIDVLAKYQVKDIWLNGDTATSATYSQFMNSVKAEGATIHQAERGNTIQVGTLKFNVLNPSKPVFSNENDNSIVVSLSYGGVDFLFTGDAEKDAEARMLVQSVVPIPDVEILKVGHHGSRTASSPAFLNIIKPDVAVYSAGMGNTYGHPHQETLIALDSIGTKIYGTDMHGTVVINTDGKVYNIQPKKQAPPVKPSSVSPIPNQPAPNLTVIAPPPNQVTVNPPLVTVQAPLKITKIFYDGVVPSVESDEYVEITNLGSESVNLKGWVVKDISDGYPSFTFPSYVLQPGRSVRVYTNEIHPEYGGFSYGSGKAVWNNTSPDTAALFNPQGQEVSRKSY